MNTKKSIYQNASVNTIIALIVLAGLMVGFSLYLTQHYFDLRFPTGLEGKSLCNINSFFNCSKTTFSHLSNIAGVPIALDGVLIGILALAGLAVRNEDFERTMYFTLLVNGIGCAILFLFSLFVLHGLCPFCSLYYITSGLLLFLFFKKSTTFKPSLPYLAVFAVIFIACSLIMKNTVDEKEKAQREISSDLIKQYYSLPNLGSPSIASLYKIADHPNAPIKMVIFSDFECPACRALSEIMPQIVARYGEKIDIQYYYYPLDNSCNPHMERPLHQYACKAAYAATCMPSGAFSSVHDELFKNQDKFESGYLDEYIKNNKLENCIEKPETKNMVLTLIQAATPFNIRSTPSYLINGVKIEGALPIDQLNIIFDEILKRAK